MGVKDYEGGNRVSGDAAGEEVGDKNTGGEEEGAAGEVEGWAVVGWEVGGHIARVRVGVFGVARVLIQGFEDGRFLGVGGGEDEEGALGWVVEAEEGGYDEVKGKASGNDDDATIGVIEQIGNDLFFEGEHRHSFESRIGFDLCSYKEKLLLEQQPNGTTAISLPICRSRQSKGRAILPTSGQLCTFNNVYLFIYVYYCYYL